MRDLGALIGVEAIPYGEVRLKHLRARPDYAVNIGQVRVGYIELKRPGKGVPGAPEWRPDKRELEQWGKLSSLPNVMYSDGVNLGAVLVRRKNLADCQVGKHRRRIGVPRFGRSPN